MSIGMDALSGKHLGDLAHLLQSIRDILGTRIGTRVMRYDYGSRLADLIDTPASPDRLIEFYAATAEALARWEDRFQLTQVTVESVAPGSITLKLDGVYLPNGEAVTFEGVTVT